MDDTDWLFLSEWCSNLLRAVHILYLFQYLNSSLQRIPLQESNRL